MNKKWLLVVALLLLISDLADAQSFYNRRRNRRLIIGGGTGTASYFGDLADPGDFFNLSFNTTVGVKYWLGNRFFFRN
ncbi:MAG: hypothetical protein HC842_09310 [Cytophagales bacterium]|nr:hypothetical protein [Cytophagales bacterium]